jgi:hypothetical protein
MSSRAGVDFTTTWLRLETRRRWRSLLVLALLVALASGTILAAVAGARRGHNASDRLADRTLPAEFLVIPEEQRFDWDPVRALPEVKALATFAQYRFRTEDPPDDGSFRLQPADPAALTTIERPVVLDGRLADPSRSDEVMVTPVFRDNYGKDVGDRVSLRLPTPEEADALDLDPTTPMTGPIVQATVVGVIRSPRFIDEVGSTGKIVPSLGLFTEYRANVLGAQQHTLIPAGVRLQGGLQAEPAFREALTRLTGRQDINVVNLAPAPEELDVDAFESAFLLAFALAAAAAAVLLVGQAVARHTAATVSELLHLQASGVTPRQTVSTAAVGPVVAAAAGALVGVAGAVVASRWMPIGSAELSEPEPGMQFDGLVLISGWFAAVLLVSGGAVLAAWMALPAGVRPADGHRSVLASAARRAGLAVPVQVGARFALERGGGRRSVPVRPALLGATVGVVGVLGAFTFADGVSDALDNPARFGQTHQLEAYVGFNNQDAAPAAEVLTAMAGVPDVAGVNNLRARSAGAGELSVFLFTYDPVTTDVPTSPGTGRLPGRPDQVALGPATAKALGADVGSRVSFTGDHGAQDYTVTGVAYVPESGSTSYEEGAWVTAAGFDRLFAGFAYRNGNIALRSGADLRAAAAALTQSIVGIPGGEFVTLHPPKQPAKVEQLRDVRAVPIALGGFLLVLAIGAVGHGLATAARRRRPEMAVLRAVGMTPGQARAVVAVQASVLAIVALAFGVPLGLAAGRVLWQWVADSLPLAYVNPSPWWALILVGPLALLVANLLAAWPARQAARTRIGDVLRAE